MAKRKRLTPAQSGFSAVSAPVPRPPIAQVAGDVALTAAFEEVQAELQAAQREGRMVLSLPLDAVQGDYLIRDRQSNDPEDMAALKVSLTARGQQTPIEVVALEDGSFGLISGWRRLLALSELLAETGAVRFGTINALLRQPEDRSAAYVAMIEENEIRADLSIYERARIALLSVRAGVYDSEKQALQTLYSAVSFSKRSKVKSFFPLVDALDEVLCYPGQIPERLGLALSKALVADTTLGARLCAALAAQSNPAPAEERAVLEAHLRLPNQQNRESNATVRIDLSPEITPISGRSLIAPGIHISAGRGRVELVGDGVNGGFIDRLSEWLRTQR